MDEERGDHGDREVAAWQQTLDEMESMAADRASEGWETLTVTAADTAPEPPDAGQSDRFGLVYTVDEETADAFPPIHEKGFDRYEVYRRRVGNVTYLVTELQNTERREVVFVAGAVEMEFADELLDAAAERGELYTHLQTLDWTHVGSVRHDDPAAFFPSLAE